MTYLSELRKNAPAGDSFAADVSAMDMKPEGYAPSDVPGFVNPVIGGEPDTTRYIPEGMAGQDDTAVSKAEAEEMSKKREKPEDILYGGA